MALLKHIKKWGISVGLLIVLLFSWFNPFAQKQTVDPSGWKQLIPSANLDDRIQCMKGNNNLDVTEYHGQYYIAFRTAPSHFASKKTKLYIISSTDLDHWELEHEIHLGYDMREPRFAVYQDSLRLYFFEGGKKALRFEPRHMWMTTYRAPAKWSDLYDMQMDGYVNWRFRERWDTLYMSAYYGKDLYNTAHEGNQRLYRSSDGRKWQPISTSAQIPDMGAEEGEFIFDEEGNLWGTVRMEGDGAMVVYAPSHDISQWQTKYTEHKYDSALLFEHDSEVYLISRRNLDGTSRKSNLRLYNMLRYSVTRKKTALFHLDKEKMELVWVKDFPSTGDTAFPGIVSIGDGKYFLLNYSSNIHGKEKSWIKGQLGKTYIYSTILDMNEIISKIEK